MRPQLGSPPWTAVLTRVLEATARAVASSNLVKTAVHGGDPNWGRIVCALGYSGCELAIDRLTVTVAGLTVFTAGAGVEDDLGAVGRAFQQAEIEIVADLGLGPLPGLRADQRGVHDVSPGSGGTVAA